MVNQKNAFLFTFLHISLLFSLVEDRRTLTAASALLSVVFVWLKQVTKIWPHTHTQLEEGYFTAFSDTFGWPSLILHQNSPSGGFLKVSWNMKSETLSLFFVLC